MDPAAPASLQKHPVTPASYSGLLFGVAFAFPAGTAETAKKAQKLLSLPCSCWDPLFLLGTPALLESLAGKRGPPPPKDTGLHGELETHSPACGCPRPGRSGWSVRLPGKGAWIPGGEEIAAPWRCSGSLLNASSRPETFSKARRGKSAWGRGEAVSPQSNLVVLISNGTA